MTNKPMTAVDPRDGLLPCPFCGSDPEVDSYDAHAGTFVQCCNCGARVNGGESEWNARIAHARPEAVDERVVRQVAIAINYAWIGVDGSARHWWAQLGSNERKHKDDVARAAIAAYHEALTPERAP